MSGPLTEDELAELEAEVQQMSSWALDEADVRRLQLRRQAFDELRDLRRKLAESEMREASLREQLDNAEEELALTRASQPPS
ncbi:MAG TPA: hypothetical protein VLW85_22505 [Myxococcales bacterium]|nr:hypothetical protein [Myxococcales bacterium]